VELLNRIPKSCLLLGGIYFFLQMIGLCLLCEKDLTSNDSSLEEENQNLLINSDDAEISTEPLLKKSTESDTNSLGVKYELVGEGMEIQQVLRTPTFYLIALMLSTTTIGNF
jgi:hypothetical protein